MSPRHDKLFIFTLPSDGREVTVTETLDRDHATVVTTTNVSGVTNPHITKQRAGLTVWEVTPSVTAPTITGEGQGDRQEWHSDKSKDG